MTHEERVKILFEEACRALKIQDITLRFMRGRKVPVNTARNYSLGYIDLRKRAITLDILTPRRREPKSLKSLARVLAHEIAHLQKPPYQQRYRGRWIVRQHYPAFYRQVNRNIKKLFKNRTLAALFEEHQTLDKKDFLS